MIRCGDVVQLFDATAAGDAKDRMWVCLDPVNGWFARIVTREPRHYPIRLRAADRGFLDHDSHIETGIPVQFYDEDLQEADTAGPVGRIADGCCQANDCRLGTGGSHAPCRPRAGRAATARDIPPVMALFSRRPDRPLRPRQPAHRRPRPRARRPWLRLSRRQHRGCEQGLLHAAPVRCMRPVGSMAE